MTNQDYLIKALGGFTCFKDPDVLTLDELKLVNCPYEIAEEGDCYEGTPTNGQCAECKRRWLRAEKREEKVQ